MHTGTKLTMSARTNVHFSAVSERFTPHDATFNASAATDLSEPALSATCSLHTATSLYSSTSSLRRQNLSEITEDAEEVSSTDPAVSSILARPRADKSPKLEDGPELLQQQTGHQSSAFASQVDARTMNVQETVQGPRKHEELPSMHSGAAWTVWNEDFPSQTSKVVESRRISSEDRPRTSNHLDSTYESIEGRLQSTSSSRPSTSELFKYGLWKPKVKLFARPVAEAQVKSPKVTDGVRQRLPSGMRPRKNELNRPRSAKSARSTVASESSRPGTMQSAISTPRPLPDDPVAKAAPPVPPQVSLSPQSTPVERLRPVASLENTTYLPSAAARESSTVKRISISPEKQRLMKALKLRKEQLEGSTASAAIDARITRSDGNIFMDPRSSASKTDAGVTVNVNLDAKPSGSVLEQERLLEPTDAAPESGNINPIAVEHNNHNDLPFVNGDIPYIFTSTALATSESLLVSQLRGQNMASANVAHRVVGHYNLGHRRMILSNTFDGQRSVDTHEKRHGLVEPLRVKLISEETDDGSLSDDSLIEELKLAKLQEAKPIPISHSPARVSFSSATGDPQPSFNSVTSVMILNTARNGRERTSAQPAVQHPASFSSPVDMTRKERASLSKRPMCLRGFRDGSKLLLKSQAAT